MLIAARYVLPVESPPIENGVVEFDSDRIIGVGRAADFSSKPTIDFGDAVITPGFVNSHTHLDLTHLVGLTPPTPDFAAWLANLGGKLRSSLGGADTLTQAVQNGARQSLAHGVTTIGDITRVPEHARAALAATPLRGISFGEVIAIGSIRNAIDRRLDAAAETSACGPRWHAGISPHAPYTVEPQALRQCVRRAIDSGLRLTIHVAETAAEAEFTMRRAGPLADHLRAMNVWDDEIPCCGAAPLDLVESCGALGPRTIIAHMNYASDDNVATLARSETHVAYCPRTHSAFGHLPHRFRDMLRAGINVCIGTDSLASNPSLSVLDELRFLRIKHPDVPAEQLLKMGTIRGAQALGLSDAVGSLAVGKLADLAVLPLPKPGSAWQDSLLDNSAPMAVYVSGERLH